MILWGGQDVVIKYIEWLSSLKKGNYTAQTFYQMEDFFFAIRKDLGHKNNKLKKGTFIHFILKNPEIFLELTKNNPNISLEKIEEERSNTLFKNFYNNNEVIHEVLYPELDFDYVPDWTGDIDIMNAIIQMADEIGFTMPIVALPRENNPDKDYKMRVEEVYFSSYNTALYSGQWNDNHYMEKIGSRIAVSPSYYAMLNHLNIDDTISITEPMANIVKGQLPVSGAKLSYIAKSADIERLRGVQINTIIKEIDGIYFIDQLTAYKSASKLSRINVVKVIHRMRKDLPKILKDLLQRKALENIILSAKSRTEQYMSRWLVTDNNTTDGIFSEITVTPLFVEEELKLIISIAVKPIGTIEKIEVPITVY
jgi:hypothetical protein